MVGFRATATSEQVRVDGVELLEARWFTRAELRERVAAGRRLGRVDSIDHQMLTWTGLPRRGNAVDGLPLSRTDELGLIFSGFSARRYVNVTTLCRNYMR